MIVTELRLSNSILIIFLLTTTSISFINAGAGRCYLCSQNTLAECVGSMQTNSPLFTTVLQYYTEPCNGQCILFRNEKGTIIRGCSWTYGHMTPKSMGWHELSPGIQAYFCDSYLCNNGTLEKSDTAIIRTGILNDETILTPQQTFSSPQQLFNIKANTPPLVMMHTEQHLPSTNDIPRQLRQCYICTARLTGCGEYLDPRYASKYIQPCASSCIVFRNPNDYNLITRDCSTSWPQIHAKSGLHKLLGSDAFLCQESLCNGINFDFIMGIFHNQIPAVITFPSTENIEDTSTTTISTTIPMTTTFPIDSIPTTTINTVNIHDDPVIWEDPDLDFVMVEATTTAIPISATTTFPLPTELPDDVEVIDESTTIPLQTVEHFDFIENIPASSTIAGGMAVAGQDSQFNWWDINEVSFTPFIGPMNFPSTTQPTINLSSVEEDDWAIFNTTSIPTPSNSDTDFDINDYFLPPGFSITPTIDLISNNTPPFVPYFFTDYQPNNQLFGLIKPDHALAVPPFAWMLNLAKQNNSELQGQKTLINKNFTRATLSTTTTETQKKKKKRIDSKKTIVNHLNHFSDYCNKKKCQHGGRLNADCLCICLPSFSGNNCERVDCNQEPAHICDFALEHECKSEYVRYLCPKFCQMNICSSNKSSSRNRQ